MPVFKRPDAELYYEVHGSGFPLLLFAPGGLKSQLQYWRHSPANPDQPAPWMDPMKALADRFTVVGMDQRNAGQSTGAVRATHGWPTFASDHLALMDHCEMAPERVSAAVLQNPIGMHDNRDTWDDAVSGYAKTVLARDPDLTPDVVQQFGQNMFGGEFVFSVTREFVKHCSVPLFLQPGTDKPHPAKTSAEIEQLAPKLEVQKDWRGPTHLQESIKRVGAFLGKHAA